VVKSRNVPVISLASGRVVGIYARLAGDLDRVSAPFLSLAVIT
jgi:hypothetical protein